MEGKDYIDNDKINYDENASLDDVEKDYVDYIEEERKNMRLKGSTDE